MTKEEYLARGQAEDDWAPGWLAIDEAFGKVYPGVTPPHFGANIAGKWSAEPPYDLSPT